MNSIETWAKRHGLKYEPTPFHFQDSLADLDEMLENVFCPTGKGGGIKATCGSGPSGQKASKDGGKTSLTSKTFGSVGDKVKGLVKGAASKLRTMVGSGAHKKEKDKPDDKEKKNLTDKVKQAGTKASELYGAATAKLTGKAKGLYNRLPKSAQKLVNAGMHIEHRLEKSFKNGQAIAKEIARGKGLNDNQVARVSRILALGDGVGRWTGNIPVAHAMIHSLAHIGGPVAFLGAKAGWYIPAASLGYIGYSMAGAALRGKNPIKLLNEARRRVRSSAGPLNNILSLLENAESSSWAELVADWMAPMDDDQADWAEALLAAALDETGGDKEKALAVAIEQFEEDEDLDFASDEEDLEEVKGPAPGEEPEDLSPETGLPKEKPTANWKDHKEGDEVDLDGEKKIFVSAKPAGGDVYSVKFKNESPRLLKAMKEEPKTTKEKSKEKPKKVEKPAKPDGWWDKGMHDEAVILKMTPQQIDQAQKSGMGPHSFMTSNTFCPTGEGGGIKPDCGSGAGGAKKPKQAKKKDVLTTVVRGADKKLRMSDGSDLPDHIKKLAIPPAWKNVQVNLDPKGTILAKGVDAKGRTQAKYSDTHSARAAAAKFGRVTELRKKREGIFKELEKDSKNPARKDVAECLRVVMQTGMRPGGGDDTKADHKSYGATTLEGRHVVTKDDGSVSLVLVTGKNKGREVEFPITDKATAFMLQERAKASGPDGKLFATNANDLRNYSKGKDGGGFKTKDHRTALGTETAIASINSIAPPTNLKEYKKAIKQVATAVANTLGNTPAVAIKSYIDPQVFLDWRRKAGV